MVAEEFIDPVDFQKSVTRELSEIKNRVRNLIGNSHWGEEGRYKEAILRKTLDQFLPYNISTGTGFIIDPSDGLYEVSKQIDIIIYNINVPPIFSEGDFIITTKQSVRGTIEVKTKLRESSLKDAINHAEEVGEHLDENTFNGIFSYDYEGGNLEEDQDLKRVLQDEKRVQTISV